jgi:hypothetical protein
MRYGKGATPPLRRGLIAFLVLCGAMVSVAQAATDLAPMTARVVKLGGISALTSYTVEKDGFRVVTTIQSDDAAERGLKMPPVRFIVTLAANEEARISVPRDADPAIELQIARIGDRIEIRRVPDLLEDAAISER